MLLDIAGSISDTFGAIIIPVGLILLNVVSSITGI